MKSKSRTPKTSVTLARGKTPDDRAEFHSQIRRAAAPGNLSVICQLDSVFGPRITLGFRSASL